MNISYFPIELYVQNLPAGSELSVDVKVNNAGYPNAGQLAFTLGKPLTNDGGIALGSQEGSSNSVSIQNITFSPTNVTAVTNSSGSTTNFIIKAHLVAANNLPQSIFFDINMPSGTAITSTINGFENSPITQGGQSQAQTVGS